MKKNIEISPNIATLFGTRDENLRLLENGMNVAINLRAESVEITGAAIDVGRAEQVFVDYEHLLRNGHNFVNGDLGAMIRVLTSDSTATLRSLAEAGKQRSFGKRTVQPKSINQRRYLEAIEKHDMVFGIGPAGTGKTYLAVAMAISALLSKRVNRIVLARPAVEAGERLGFLPGTLQEKVDPYLRPLYDALYDMLEPDKVDRYLEKNVIEIAPIAFMRGRTLNDAFVILDEAQNTTSEQMKMFVTRLGFNSKAAITGDVTQIDLPNANRSGLVEAVEILGKVEGIHFCYFDEGDVVRHHLVQRIIRAYEDHKGRNEQLSLSLELKNGNGYATSRSSDGRVYTTSIEPEAPLAEVASCRGVSAVARSHFRVETWYHSVGGLLALPFLLETKVVILEHDEDVRERALGAVCGKSTARDEIARRSDDSHHLQRRCGS
jgi:phosphate starvation-inducible protein PhoH and related proteins